MAKSIAFRFAPKSVCMSFSDLIRSTPRFGIPLVAENQIVTFPGMAPSPGLLTLRLDLTDYRRLFNNEKLQEESGTVEK